MSDEASPCTPPAQAGHGIEGNVTYIRGEGYSRALAWARGQAGKPYVWRGTSPARARDET